MLKNAMNYGVVLGALLVLLQVLSYTFDIEQSKWLSLLNYLILSGVLYYGTKRYRDTENGGYISYGQSLGSMVLIGVFGSILIGFYMFVFYKYIAPDTLEQMKILAEQQYVKLNMPQNQIDMSLRLITPATLVFSAIFGYAIFSALLGLFLSLFIKKQDPSILE